MNGAIDATIASALEEAVPGREVDDVAPAGVSWNDQNETVRVAFADGDAAYLKVAADGDGSRIARERAVIEYVGARRTVAVPRVVASDPTGDPPHLLTAPMAGRSFAEARDDWGRERRVRMVHRAGAALAAVHSLSFDRHGHVVGGDADDLAVDEGSWTEVLVELIRANRERASSDRFEEYFDEVVAAVRANRDLLDDAPATLVHGDPAGPNLFADGDAVGAVDWEVAHVGDPARELRRAEEQLLGDGTERLVAALHEGYADRAGSIPEGFEDRAPVYDAVWHVNTLGLFDKWAEWRDEPREEAARAAEAKMERYLEAIR